MFRVEFFLTNYDMYISSQHGTVLKIRKKQGGENYTTKTILLKLFRPFKRIFEKTKLYLFEKVMNLYEFKNLRLLLPT